MSSFRHALAVVAAVLLSLCFGGSAAATLPDAGQFHSFSELVRLTAAAETARVAAAQGAPVGRAATGHRGGGDKESASAGGSRPPAGETPAAAAGRALRVGILGIGTAQANAGEEQAGGRLEASYRFAVSALPEPQAWMLVLAGVAAALWVARRRMRFPILG